MHHACAISAKGQRGHAAFCEFSDKTACHAPEHHTSSMFIRPPKPAWKTCWVLKPHISGACLTHKSEADTLPPPSPQCLPLPACARSWQLHQRISRPPADRAPAAKHMCNVQEERDAGDTCRIQSTVQYDSIHAFLPYCPCWRWCVLLCIAPFMHACLRHQICTDVHPDVHP